MRIIKLYSIVISIHKLCEPGSVLLDGVDGASTRLSRKNKPKNSCPNQLSQMTKLNKRGEFPT